MKLIALTVLLSIMQAAPPVPRKTADNPAQATTNVKRKSASDRDNSAPVPSPAKADGNGPAKTNSGEQHPENTEHSVSVSKLPPVTLNPSKRDVADWGYWAFTLLLVVVGFLQMLLLWRTLGAIRRQADSMERQATKLDESVAVADKAAAAATLNAQAVIDAERAWLLVDEVQFSPVQEPLLSPTPRFTYRIQNFGKTPGIIMGCKAEFQVGGDMNTPKDLTFVNLAGTEVESEIHIVPQGESVPRRSKFWDNYLLAQGERDKIYSRDSFLWACGCVHYKDVFGRRHRTPFCYIYIASEKKFYPGGLLGFNLPD